MAPLPTATFEILTHLFLPRSSATSTTAVPSPSSTHTNSSAVDSLPGVNLKDPAFGLGAKPAKDFNNQFFLALFAALGAAFALLAIWFFFWARNGGFKFQEGDWDDYKSTVLRRKGPDGKTLSNATKSTRLGGGSVVHGQKWHGGKKKKGSKTEKTGGGSSTGYTDNTYSAYDEYNEKDGLRGGGGSGYLNAGRPAYSGSDRRHDDDLAGYRHEKAAKVGGLNRQHDGSHFDYSNQSDLSQSQRPLVGNGSSNNDKDRKKRDEADKAAREKARKEAAKREKEQRKAEKSKSKDNKYKKSAGGGGVADSSVETKDFAAAATTTTTPTHPRAPPTTYTFSPTGDDDGSSHYTGPSQGTQQSSYYNSYRPVASSSPNTTPTHAQRYRDRRGGGGTPDRAGHSGSPGKRARQASSHGVATSASSDTGTKVYSHHIPGLSKGASEVGVDESVSQVGGRRAAAPQGGGAASGGYRRTGLGGGGGIRMARRDSLSDSE